MVVLVRSNRTAISKNLQWILWIADDYESTFTGVHYQEVSWLIFIIIFTTLSGCFGCLKLTTTNYITHVKSQEIGKDWEMMQVQDKTSVIRQKDESQNECFKKTKHVKISQKRTFLTPWYAHIRCSFVCFSEYLTCFVFLKHPNWNRSFVLLPSKTKYLNLW